MIKPKSCRTTLLAILSLAVITACHQPKAGAGSSTTATISDSLAAHMQGTYVGKYSKGLITLVINYISGNTASGFDLHKGLRRNLNGQVEQKDGKLNFVLKEPGGNPYDGTFYLALDTITLQLAGKWVPTDSTKAKTGEMRLLRKVATDETEYIGAWMGDLGDLMFETDGTCTLQYYPATKDSTEKAQVITIRGNYEKRDDTFRIDWQRNSRTPTLNMKLVRQDFTEATDSTEAKPIRLVGNGVTFNERPG